MERINPMQRKTTIAQATRDFLGKDKTNPVRYRRVKSIILELLRIGVVVNMTPQQKHPNITVARGRSINDKIFISVEAIAKS